MKLGVMLITAVAGVGGLLYLATRPVLAANEISLEAGWNEVTYTGRTQTVANALQSIISQVVAISYLDPIEGIWVLATYDTLLKDGMVIGLEVTEACIWKF
ncbi:unnamed protein product [marine sediment metagenome]|uniref:Uncharacterized protein n=1 Tax=marine sediment metagenome TaxID=412755 RepID=X1T180_9ZZZZ